MQGFEHRKIHAAELDVLLKLESNLVQEAISPGCVPEIFVAGVLQHSERDDGVSDLTCGPPSRLDIARFVVLRHRHKDRHLLDRTKTW